MANFLLLVLLIGVVTSAPAQEMHWKVVATLGDTVNTTVGGISCTAGGHCFATAIWRGDEQSNVYRSTDEGRSWAWIWHIDASDSMPIPPTVGPIAVLSPQTVIVGSDSGRVLISHDSGRTFLTRTLITGPALITSSDAADDQNAIFGPAMRNAVAFVTSDAGQSWDTLKRPDDVAADVLQGVSMPTPNVVLLLMNSIGVGHPLARSDDRGRTWQVYRTLPRGSYQIDFVDSLHGWVAGAVGSGNNDTSLIAATSDGGRTWVTQWRQRLPSGHGLRDIAFADLRNGTAVGGGYHVLRTTDGGATWVMDPADVPHEVIRPLYVAAVSGGYVMATQKGVILRPASPSGVIMGHDRLQAGTIVVRGPFPNPAASGGVFGVEVTLEQRTCVSISLVGSNGDIVWRDPCRVLANGTHVLAVGVGDASAGRYLLRIEGGGQTRAFPFVVE